MQVTFSMRLGEYTLLTDCLNLQLIGVDGRVVGRVTKVESGEPGEFYSLYLTAEVKDADCIREIRAQLLDGGVPFSLDIPHPLSS